MPAEPEAHGLLALMLHCQARRKARHSRDGCFIPLDHQDTNLWSCPLMEEAEEHLRLASGMNRLGRFQPEAAVQSVHARRAVTGETEWQAIVLLAVALTDDPALRQYLIERIDGSASY